MQESMFFRRSSAVSRRSPSALAVLSAAVLAAATLAGSAAAAPAVAQSLDLFSVASPEHLLPPSYTDPEGTVRLVSEMRARDPHNIDLHLADARESSALGLLDETPEARASWLVRAEEVARAAVAIDSTHADARYWLAASLGLRADVAGGRDKISLAREAYRHATRTLELDSLHAGANHIVGRLHAGARRLSWLNRLIARTLGLGEILGEASWESAERHMRIAAERAPGELVHLHDLGRLLLQQRIDVEEGRAILSDLAARTPRHDLDAHYIRRAQESLAELGEG